jgi:Uncharacterized protein conserved in bacteria
LSELLPEESGLSWDELCSDYNCLRGVYAAAIREVNSRLQTLNAEFSFASKHNPIHHMESRIKSLTSIVKKLEGMNITPSMINAKKNLRDIAGVRVVCRYQDDIYRIANLLLKQDDVNLILKKDYIQNPKENGYRSLHIVVDVPVYMIEGKLYTPVEIQIRTVAMDFWATLEHGIRYKASEEVPPELVQELRSCADVITETDRRMQDIFRTLQTVRNNVDASAFEVPMRFLSPDEQ